jgi:hypothetical protein
MQNAKAIPGVVVGDALDEAGQNIHVAAMCWRGGPASYQASGPRLKFR